MKRSSDQLRGPDAGCEQLKIPSLDHGQTVTDEVAIQEPAPKKPPKVLRADRRQLRIMPLDLEAAIPHDDPVRAVWGFVERLDLSSFYEAIRSFEGEVGRAPIDPKILLALWIQATLDGIGSAREVSRLCEMHLRYQWICGGVMPNYHTLSDFRSNSVDEFTGLLTETVAVLLEQGLVQMQRVAQDGMRVRASAGAASFRRRTRLEELRGMARDQVEQLTQELDSDPQASSKRQAAARQRAAEEREKRIEQALAQLPQAEESKRSHNGKKKTEARVSTTDPEARVMKMADGGFRPAFNVHFVSDTVSKAILTVEVNNQGTDVNMMVPLADQLEKQQGEVPQEWLADGGCVNLDAIEKLAEKKCSVIAPPRKPRKEGIDPTEVRPDDSPAIAGWRRRMRSDYGKTIYKLRGATAELANAQTRAHGLLQFLVRGTKKVLAVALLHALVHNFCRTLALHPAT